jgi:cytochrome P450
MGWESIISQMNSGPRWRKHRRIIQEKFGPRHLSDYAEMQKGVTYDFLAGLGKAPKKLEDHIKRYAVITSTSSHRDHATYTDSVRSLIKAPSAYHD